MLIGHYAPALVLQRARPSVKLWQLFVATQLVDVLWAAFVFSGIEHARIVPGFTASNDLDLWDMPYTHSLVGTVAWAALAFVVWWFMRREPTRTGNALVIAAAVASHFVADLVVHVRDLPVTPGGAMRLGFGLWRSRPLALAVEVGAFAAAAWWWWWPRRVNPGAQAAGTVLLGLTAFAAVTFYVPTPPSPSAMALTGLATWAVMAVLAGWIDRRSAPA